MSITFTPTTNFGAKDGLPANDPNKVIKGAEFTTEFTAIQSAFNLAAPTSAPVFTGTATFSDLTVNGTATLADANVTTLDVSGAFTSQGIDDNATSTAITIDSSENVGIGTASPVKKLDVTGTSRITGEATFGNDVLLTNDAYVYSSNGGSGVRAGWLLDGTNQAVRGYTAGTERMRIDSSGNVGIGTDSPDALLHVNVGGTLPTLAGTTVAAISRSASCGLSIISGNTNFGRISFGDNADEDVGSIAYFHNDNSMRFSTSASEAMHIDSSGNVGIGTDSPSTILHTQGTSGTEVISGVTTNTVAKFEANANDGGHLTINGAGSSTTGVTTLLNRVNGGDLAFAVRTSSINTEAMRIDASGNLLVGTTSNIGGSRLIASAVNSRAATFYRTTSSNVNVLVGFESDFSGGGLQCVIRADGDLENTNNSYGGISDISYKENIVDASPQLDDIMAMRVRSYNLKSTGAKHIGVIAQELEETSPELVKTGEDGLKSVKYSVMYMKAIKAIQEQQAMIEELKAEVAALKGA